MGSELAEEAFHIPIDDTIEKAASDLIASRSDVDNSNRFIFEFKSAFLQGREDVATENLFKDLNAYNDSVVSREVGVQDVLRVPGVIAKKKLIEDKNFQPINSWEGVVTEIRDDEIVTNVKDLRLDGAATEEVTFDFSDIPAADLDLVQVGAVFYWNIGYWRLSTGQVLRASDLRFRRLPAWSQRELDQADTSANELFNLFSK